MKCGKSDAEEVGVLPGAAPRGWDESFEGEIMSDPVGVSVRFGEGEVERSVVDRRG